MPSENTQAGAFAPALHKMSSWVNVICERFLFGLILAMVLVTTAQIVFRFFFEALSWSEELSCFLLVLASLVGSSIAFKRGSHIAITFIVERIPETPRKMLATVVYLLGLAFFCVVAIYGVVLMRAEAGQVTPALQISMKWVYLMYPIFGAATALHLADGVVSTWEGARS